ADGGGAVDCPDAHDCGHIGGIHPDHLFCQKADHMSSESYINRPNRPLQLYAIIFLIVLYVPVLFLPLFSFNDSVYVKFPLEGFTLQWYKELFGRPAVWAALSNSLKVGIVVSIISTAL